VKRSRHVRRLGRLAPDLSRNPFRLRAVESVVKYAWERFREGTKSRPVVVPFRVHRNIALMSPPITASMKTPTEWLSPLMKPRCLSPGSGSF